MEAPPAGMPGGSAQHPYHGSRPQRGEYRQRRCGTYRQTRQAETAWSRNNIAKINFDQRIRARGRRPRISGPARRGLPPRGTGALAGLVPGLGGGST